MARRRNGSKRKSGDVSVDRFSNLPEEIICHILSFLPTRDAVKTTILSPKFLNLWKNIKTLNFSQHAGKPRSNFVNFVYMVFIFLETKCIDKLSIEFSDVRIIRENLRNWVVAANANNVKSFELFNSGLPSFIFDGSYRCIFTWNSLEILELRNIVVTLFDTSSVHLPNLRILRMEDACTIDDDCIGKIVSRCSSLQTLYLSIIYDKAFELSVCSPTLEHFTIISSNKDLSSSDGDNYEAGRIKIDVPALKYLHLEHSKLKYLSIKTSSLLIVAKISLGAAKCELGTSDDLIQSLSNVKTLVLDVSDAWLEAVAHSCSLPMFPNLSDLTICNFSGEFNFVKELLQKSPTLETLGLKCISSGGRNDLSEPKLIPKFRSLFLKVVKVEDFDGSIDQLKVLKYILLNASLLRTMKIITHRECGRVRKLPQEIWIFCRRSTWNFCRRSKYG